MEAFTVNRTTKHNKTKTKQASITIEQLRKIFDENKIDHFSEKVLRMKYGISEPENYKLYFRGENNRELKIKLAMIEQNALADIEEMIDPEPEISNNAPRRAEILSFLKHLK